MVQFIGKHGVTLGELSQPLRISPNSARLTSLGSRPSGDKFRMASSAGIPCALNTRVSDMRPILKVFPWHTITAAISARILRDVRNQVQAQRRALPQPADVIRSVAAVLGLFAEVRRAMFMAIGFIT